MYPVTFQNWLRLRAGRAAFVIGSVSFVFLSLLGPALDWYGLIAFGVMFGGILYLHFVGEWLRVLYKKRKQPETRRRIVRVGTLVFFIGLLSGIIFDLPYIRDFPAQDTFRTAFLIARGLMIGTGTVIIAFAIFENWKRLPFKVEESSRNALRMMKNAGLGIQEDPLWVALDPTLRVPARNYPGGGGSVILVSPWYVDTKLFGGLDNILVHEMSHIYRRETIHPSENQEIIKDIETYFETVKQYPKKSYQLKTIVESMFNLQEIFANDIAFRVIEQSKVEWIELVREYLQDLVNSKPILVLGKTRKRWSRASLVADNGIFIAQMDRHMIPDTGDKARTANQKLLSSSGPGEAIDAYEYFHQLALGLKEDITKEQFRSILQNYTARLIELAESLGKRDRIQLE